MCNLCNGSGDGCMSAFTSYGAFFLYVSLLRGRQSQNECRLASYNRGDFVDWQEWLKSRKTYRIKCLNECLYGALRAQGRSNDKRALSNARGPITHNRDLRWIRCITAGFRRSKCEKMNAAGVGKLV